MSESWKGAVTLRENSEYCVVYLADNIHYVVIHGDGSSEMKERTR